MIWTVYILKCGDNTFYTGMTNDLQARFEAHDSGQGAKYTKGRGPLEIVYREGCESRSAAASREYAIKKLSRAEKCQLIQKGQEAEKVTKSPLSG